MQEIIDMLDVAAKNFPIKALASEIDKAESTLRNELTQQDGYKLGLFTALLIMKKTGDLRALDAIERIFGRVAFSLPRAERVELSPLISMVSNIAKEFGEHMAAVGSAIADGRINPGEATGCLGELKQLIEASVKLQAYLELIVDGRLKMSHKVKQNHAIN